MRLTGLQRRAIRRYELKVWLDRMDIYRQVYGKDGNSLGFLLIAEGLPCYVKRTPNYDTRNSPAGMSKENNIYTANDIGSHYDDDVRSLDAAFVTTRMDDSEWQKVEGAPRKMLDVPRIEFYGVPMKAPKIFVPQGSTTVWIPSDPGALPKPRGLQPFEIVL